MNEGKHLMTKPAERNIEESIKENEQELLVIKELKKALKNYLLIDDYTDYVIEDAMPAYCLILGRLEMSISRREKMLADDQADLLKQS